MRSLIFGLALSAATPFVFGGAAWADDWADCSGIVDAERAIRGCTNIIKAGHESRDSLAVAYASRGAAYGNKGDYDQAIAAENKAIELDPKLAEAYDNRGDAYLAKGDDDRAIADETKAIQLKPDYGYPYYGRGLAYAAKDDPAAALTDFRVAARLIPAADQERGQALARVADLEKQLVASGPPASGAPAGGSPAGSTDDWANCAQSADDDRSIRACTNIITAGRESRENLVTAYMWRGNAYKLKGMFGDFIGDYGNPDRAIADYDAAIKLNPQLAEAYRERGFAYDEKRDYDRAIADETKAIELNPALVDAYRWRASAYGNKGDHDREIADETKLIELQPGDENAYYFRAAAYENKGDHDRAIGDYNKAIELKPGSGFAYYGRGVANAAKGDPARALTDFRAAARLIPASDKEHGQALVRIADLEKQLAAAAPSAGSPAPASQAEAGVTAYRNGDYATAIKTLTPLAAEGDIDAQGILGLMYDTGRGVAQDYAEALKWYRKVAEQGNGKATSDLGSMSDIAGFPLPDWARFRLAALVQMLAAGRQEPNERANDLATGKFADPDLAGDLVKLPQPVLGSSSRRVALVIGNSAYQNVAHLTNPTNDAELISDALKLDGFAVTSADNLDHDGLVGALRAFANEADTADWAVVYFAGHGMEVGGTSYLIPVDAKLLTDRDIDFETVSLGQVMREIEGARFLRVVILDACRNNPFAAAMNGEGRDIGRGLARIEPARGTVVFYSAKDGTIAADGDSADSPFATALARHLIEPSVDVDKMFRLVIDDVLDATRNKQEPFMYGSLTGRQDFFFRPQ